MSESGTEEAGWPSWLGDGLACAEQCKNKNISKNTEDNGLQASYCQRRYVQRYKGVRTERSLGVGLDLEVFVMNS